MNNSKKYNAYNPPEIEIDKEDISNYPTDSYVRPGTEKKVGKLDEYNKDKQNYDKKKSRVILNESKIAPDFNYSSDAKIDDLIPADIGDAIDSVFSKVDNLLNATGKLFFGSGKRTKPPPKQKAIPTVAPRVNPPQPMAQQPRVQQAPMQPKPQPQQKQQYIPPAPAKTQEVKNTPPVTKKQVVGEDGQVDNSPPVTRTTTISELDLPLELLNDPDIVRYFDQMKLYDKKVPGGLCSLTFRQASNRLKKGRWGKLFMITYEQLKINTMTSTADAGRQRFNGMLPVYKAVGKNFTNTDELRKAIENDINMYLRNGNNSEDFHKFTYKISRNK